MRRPFSTPQNQYVPDDRIYELRTFPEQFRTTYYLYMPEEVVGEAIEVKDPETMEAIAVLPSSSGGSAGSGEYRGGNVLEVAAETEVAIALLPVTKDHSPPPGLESFWDEENQLLRCQSAKTIAGSFAALVTPSRSGGEYKLRGVVLGTVTEAIAPALFDLPQDSAGQEERIQAALFWRTTQEMAEKGIGLLFYSSVPCKLKAITLTLAQF